MKKLLLIVETPGRNRESTMDRFVIEVDALGELSIVGEGRPTCERDRFVRVGMYKLYVEIAA